MLRILIADDHKLFREGLVSMLSTSTEIEIVGQASNGKEVLKLLENQNTDVLLLDIEMPVMDGFDVIKQIHKRNLDIKILVLTMHRSSQFIKNIFRSGANGYLQKDASRTTLVEAIKTVHANQTFYTPETGKILLESIISYTKNDNISKRELEIIKLIADQMTTIEIAEELCISPHTVESHRQNILLKLGLKNTAGLVKYAVQRGLV